MVHALLMPVLAVCPGCNSTNGCGQWCMAVFQGWSCLNYPENSTSLHRTLVVTAWCNLQICQLASSRLEKSVFWKMSGPQVKVHGQRVLKTSHTWHFVLIFHQYSNLRRIFRPTGQNVWSRDFNNLTSHTWLVSLLWSDTLGVLKLLISECPKVVLRPCYCCTWWKSLVLRNKEIALAVQTSTFEDVDISYVIWIHLLNPFFLILSAQWPVLE